MWNKKEILKKAIEFVYYQVLKPIAEEYVEQTDNSWDDEALDFIDALVEYLLDKL